MCAPVSYGLTTRFAPARWILSTFRSSVARARICSFGFASRADSTDEQVVGVARQHRGEAVRAIDTGLVQDGVVGRVAEDAGQVLGARPRDVLGVAVDDDERPSADRELPAQAASHAPVAADDDVLLEVPDHCVHLPFAEDLAQAHLQHRLAEVDDAEQEHAEADEEVDDDHDAPGVAERVDLVVADGREGDHRHVEGVEEPPAFDPHEGQRGGERERDHRRDDLAPRHAAVAHPAIGADAIRGHPPLPTAIEAARSGSVAAARVRARGSASVRRVRRRTLRTFGRAARCVGEGRPARVRGTRAEGDREPCGPGPGASQLPRISDA